MGLPKFSHSSVVDYISSARNTKSVALAPAAAAVEKLWPALHVQMIERTCVELLLVHVPHDQCTSRVTV
jgi:hypothetical protein